MFCERQGVLFRFARIKGCSVSSLCKCAQVSAGDIEKRPTNKNRKNLLSHIGHRQWLPKRLVHLDSCEDMKTLSHTPVCRDSCITISLTTFTPDDVYKSPLETWLCCFGSKIGQGCFFFLNVLNLFTTTLSTLIQFYEYLLATNPTETSVLYF